MHITQLKASNVKRLKAVEITPDGKMVVVGGKNAQGKTSVLDSIWYTLGGKRAHCDRPLRDGAKSGSVTLQIGDYQVTRTFTKSGGGSITLQNAEGARYGSPQGIIDGWNGTLTFDPLAFSRMKPDAQAQALKDLVGLDFSELDAERRNMYEERRDVNRERNRLKAQYEEMEVYDDLPDEPYDLAELRDRRKRAYEKNREHDRLNAEAESAHKHVEMVRTQITETKAEIERLNKRLATLNEQMETSSAKAKEATEAAERFTYLDMAAIEDRIREAEETNYKQAQNEAAAEMKKNLERIAEEVDLCAKRIREIDEEKMQMLEQAEMPIEGLSIDGDVVTYQGVPFDQCSSAEQLRVSAAICAAMNPKLRVMLIRDGSLLDDDSMKELAAIADQHDFQIWLERVGEGEECQVVIEDGRVKGAETETEE